MSNKMEDITTGIDKNNIIKNISLKLKIIFYSKNLLLYTR